MAVAKVIEVVGSSEESWEDAAQNAMDHASESIRNITGMEVIGQNAVVRDGKIKEFRTVVKIAFEYEE